MHTRRCWRNSTPPRRRNKAPSSRWTGDPRRQHYRRADPGSARKCQLGIVTDDNTRACRRLCDSVTLSVGDRALQAQGAMSFIVENQIMLVGLFSQNGFQTIREGTPVEIVFDNFPGRIYHARVITISKRYWPGTGCGVWNTGQDHRSRRRDNISGRDLHPGRYQPSFLRLGMSGSATAFSPKAGVIGLLASILVWISSYTAYL